MISLKLRMCLCLDDDGVCLECDNDREDSQWVACDICEGWFHLGCSGLTKLPTANQPWVCSACS